MRKRLPERKKRKEKRMFSVRVTCVPLAERVSYLPRKGFEILRRSVNVPEGSTRRAVRMCVVDIKFRRCLFSGTMQSSRTIVTGFHS